MADAATVAVQVEQIGPSASRGTVRGHQVTMDRPKAKGGEDRGAMGGEHLLMALGGCFMSNLLAAGQARRLPVSGARLTIEGRLAQAPPRFEAISMTVTADSPDADHLAKLVTIAERGCIVAQTLKAGVDLRVQPASGA